MKISAQECRGAIASIHRAIQRAQQARPPELQRRFVFIGGGLVPLLISDSAAPTPRPTKDVDVVFAVASMGDYSYLRQDLLNAGFSDDITLEKPASALFLKEWRVDFLCAAPGIVDAGNRWFHAVLQDPIEEIVEHETIWRASTPSWIATKFEAWKDRGRLPTGAPDYFHQDIEDIIAVFDGRPECVSEIADGLESVKGFIRETLGVLVSNADFQSALPGHTGGHDRATIVMQRMKDIVAG